MIKASIIADSVSLEGKRITTFQVTFHRYVLAELNTHRMFSRNFRSSRAVPVKKLLAEVRSNPAIPIVWQANKSGMQGGAELTDDALKHCQNEWMTAANDAANHAERLMNGGLHKSWANRVIEPYLYVHGVVTATDYANFYALRRHADAQPEIKALADAMWEAQESSEPQLLKVGEWHLPYVSSEDHGAMGRIQKYLRGDSGLSAWTDDMYREIPIKLSVARCARVSYLTTEGKTPTIEEDLKLYDRLLGSTPLHASPAEHQATPDVVRESITNGHTTHYIWKKPHLHGNFDGWIQYRKTLPNEWVQG